MCVGGEGGGEVIGGSFLFRPVGYLHLSSFILFQLLSKRVEELLLQNEVHNPDLLKKKKEKKNQLSMRQLLWQKHCSERNTGAAFRHSKSTCSEASSSSKRGIKFPHFKPLTACVPDLVFSGGAIVISH